MQKDQGLIFVTKALPNIRPESAIGQERSRTSLQLPEGMGIPHYLGIRHVIKRGSQALPMSLLSFDATGPAGVPQAR